MRGFGLVVTEQMVDTAWVSCSSDIHLSILGASSTFDGYFTTRQIPFRCLGGGGSDF